MQNRFRIFILLALVLIATLVGVGIWYTSDSGQGTNLSRQRGRGTSLQHVWASQRSFETARQLGKLVETRDEERLSREAIQVADDELDLAYTTAIREAQLNPSAPSAQSKEVRSRIRQLEQDIKAGNLRVIELSAKINTGRSTDIEALQQQIDLAEAQISLHSEELEDAKRDLLRATDDPESRVRRLLDAHKSSFHGAQEQPAPSTRLPAFSVPTNLLTQARMLTSLRGKRSQLVIAQESATSLAKTIETKHDELEKRFKEADTGAQAGPEISTQVAAIERLSEQRNLLSGYERRQVAQQQLAQVYGNWIGLVTARQTAVIHGVLKSALYLVGLLILMVLTEMAIDRYFGRSRSDRRRLVTMRMLARFAVRFLCFVAIVLALFGSPSQLSTIIGLATAGLTVALKDFIVAFFGWFVIMGRNGIRVGDWVEINGISGEVVEIGLLRTVLLETGNFADSGHPTGRRVTFVNSFAIERHFFNFSTAGQWLWDTLEVLVPGGYDPQALIESIRKIVSDATAENSRQAEHEWQRVTHRYGVQPFSATPNIDMRPTAQGVIVNVRYITRASQRYEIRSKLYQTVVELLQNQQKRAALTN